MGNLPGDGARQRPSTTRHLHHLDGRVRSEYVVLGRPWLHSHRYSYLTPNLFTTIPKRIIVKRTFQEALSSHLWIRESSIVGWIRESSIVGCAFKVPTGLGGDGGVPQPEELDVQTWRRSADGHIC